MLGPERNGKHVEGRRPLKPMMSTAHFVYRLVLVMSTLFCGTAAVAQDGPLAPFKDQLFAGNKVLRSSDNGDFTIIDYEEMRDINGRDQEPERRVKSAYVDLSVRRQQVNETLAIGGRSLDVTRVGQAAGGRFSVIFIHGRGGDRRLGVNDYTFGGNFNRLKNLVTRNGGAYYSVSVRSFDAAGAADVAALIGHADAQTGGRPVILACASMGGIICQNIARSSEAVGQLGGMILLGGPADGGLAGTPLAKRKLPIYLAHGAADKVYKADDQLGVYRRLHDNGYPVRLRLFQSGGHGTPIRMTDWREALNFVLNTHR
jgi:hypothetical protein